MRLQTFILEKITLYSLFFNHFNNYIILTIYHFLHFFYETITVYPLAVVLFISLPLALYIHYILWCKPYGRFQYVLGTYSIVGF